MQPGIRTTDLDHLLIKPPHILQIYILKLEEVQWLLYHNQFSSVQILKTNSNLKKRWLWINGGRLRGKKETKTLKEKNHLVLLYLPYSLQYPLVHHHQHRTWRWPSCYCVSPVGTPPCCLQRLTPGHKHFTTSLRVNHCLLFANGTGNI